MSTKIKLCGLFRPEDMEYANQAKPDFAGFILSPGFRRSIPIECAAQFRSRLDGRIPAVGVFVNDSREKIISCLEKDVIQMAQLHGDETEEDIRYLKAATGKPVIKAVKVKTKRDVEAWLDSRADYLVFDSGTGSGVVFDWSLLAGVHREYFLAGGLSAGNLREAIETLRPYAVDVSSGVETDGVKNQEKMLQAVELVALLNGSEQREKDAEKKE